jgi:hypothetical protein
VDFSEVRPGDWLLIAGGAAMLIFGVALDWASFGTQTTHDAFDYFLTGGIAYILVVAAGLIAFLLAVRLIRPGTDRWPLILLVVTAVATGLMLVRLIIGAGEIDSGGTDLNLDRASGMYVAFLAAVVSLAGALMNFFAPADDENDFIDVDGRYDVSNSSDPADPQAPAS